MDKKRSISTYLPAFGVKGWGIALFAIAFFYFQNAPMQTASNFFFGFFESTRGWTNTQLSAAMTLGNVVGVVSILIWAPMARKLGSKKLAFIGMIGAAASNLLFAFFPSIPTYYAAILLFSFFSIAYSQLAVAQFAADWFPRTRGMFMGMATMGLTLSGATFTLFISKMVPSLGLTATLVIWTAVMVVISILLLIIAKDTPEEAGAWPDNDRSVTREQLEAEFKAAEEYKKNSPWNTKAVLKCPYTWTIGIGWGLCMMCASGFIGQLVPALISFGHAPTLGIVLLSSMWPAGVLGNWIGGVIDNLIGTKFASISFAVVEILACLLLATFGSSVVVATICTGIFMAAMSAFSNVTVSMATSVFGRQDFGAAWPVISVPFKIVTGFGILVISVIATNSSFSTCYYVLAAILLISVALMFATTGKQIGSQVHGEK